MATDQRPLNQPFPRRWAGFTLRIVLPAVLAGVVLVVALFVILIPFVERQLLESKKETAQELTRVAVSVLQEYRAEELAGRMTREEAQSEAALRVRLLRYGDDGKDYFWITDMAPTMIAHPYLPELEGQDLSDYEDLRGKRMFVAFVDAVRAQEGGFVDYYWQWKDDPERVVPKLSYVEAFRPWQWVVGTGIYVEDVKQGIALVERRLIQASVVVAVIIALLLLFGTRQSLKIEKRRALAERELRESHEKYLTLVEAATEGIMMALEGRCAYSNQPLLDMLGYTREELAECEISDLFVEEDGGRGTLADLESLSREESPPAPFEARLRGKDGAPVEVLLAATPIVLAGKHGFILIARSLSGQKAMQAALDETRRRFRVMSDTVSLGVFRSTWGRRATLVEANPAMRRILGSAPSVDLRGADWLDLIIDADERKRLLARLNEERAVEGFHLGLRREDGGRADVSLFAVLAEDPGGAIFCDGLLEDVTARRRDEKEREAVIAQLQTSLFYLQEPIRNALIPAVTLDRGQSVCRAAATMTKRRVGAAFVTDSDGALMGVVTDHDFRDRVVAAGLDPASPVRSIMTAPVASIPSQAPVYEGLLLMQERQVEHLAVLDENGRLEGAVRLLDISAHQRSAPVILTDSIGRATTVDEINAAHERLPELVEAVVDSDSQMRYVNRIISSVSDATVQRLLALALDELGPAPVPFAFLALGSEGREEQTLATDQDNALLYSDPSADEAEAVAEYFLTLGTLVCDRLDEVGYTYCEGGVMAKNPRWNQPLSVWREQFADWVHNADSQALLELNMLFDFRCVAGEASLAKGLRDWVFEQMQGYPLFFVHFARNALLYKPQLGVLGGIKAASSGDGPPVVSLKESLLPISNFSRLYALKHRVDSTNTLDRLAELYERGVIRHQTYDELVPDYEALMRLRLRHQAVAMKEGRRPDNLIAPDQLNSTEEARLKRLFSITGELRKKISFDFLGGMEGL